MATLRTTLLFWLKFIFIIFIHFWDSKR